MHGLTLATREYPTVKTHLKQQLKARQNYCIMYLVCFYLCIVNMYLLLMMLPFLLPQKGQLSGIFTSLC